ncbi:MAG: nucleotidyltransferase domain-containing protein [Oscillospiraceae bacterium]|jgi:predicted nucleotidyltransferase|nr:nucleotidyltransferase domain-containing protein [Oscillospiraceae bacterium]
MTDIYTIDELKERVNPIAKKYNLKAVWVFGSYAKGKANKYSDIDLLVDLKGSAVLGLIIAALFDDFLQTMQKEVDMVTVSALSQKDNDPMFKENVLNERILLYGN